MANPVNLSFHQQNTDVYCGAACAMMVLRGAGVGISALTQKELFDDSNSSPGGDTGNWNSFPDGLVTTLNAEWDAHWQGQPNHPGTRFILFICDSAADLLQVVRATMEDASLEAAPIVVRSAGAHWITVKQMDVGPAAAGTGIEPILGFHVHDPWPPLDPEADTTPHDDGDQCGSTANKSWPCHHVNLEYWNRKYIRPVNRAGLWHDKRLAICLSHDGALATNHIIEVGGLPDPDVSGAASGPLLTPGQIKTIADDLPGTTTFPEGSCLWTALKGAVADTPLLVEPLDEEETAYYIVPYRRRGTEGDDIPLLVIFDAYTGAYEEAVGMPEGTTYDPRWIEPEAIAEEADRAGNALEPAPDRPEFPFRLVWAPRYETLSRFFPLFVATKVTNQDAVYVRIDTREFSDLTMAQA